jgi:1-deoxyxylulose-5-phosphate synthase
MDYVPFGRCGLKVSRLCMGTMTFGEQADEAESVRMVNRAMDAGINFFDTANLYVAGKSEEILGRALKGKRESLVVTSKVFYATGKGPNEGGLSRKHIMRAIEDSLRRLQMEYVDIYFFHAPDYDTPIEESLAAADELVRAGKVRYLAVSNFAAWQVCRALSICDKRDLTPVVAVQPRYNLIARDIEQELLPMCREMGLGAMVYNPLAGGLLTGKHRPGAAPAAGTRFALKEFYRKMFWHERMLDAADRLRIAAEGAGMTIVQMAFRWLLARPGVTTVILGASSLKQLDANLEACAGGAIPPELAAVCDEVWQELRGPSPRYNR